MKALSSLETPASVNSGKYHNIPEEHPQHQRCRNLKLLTGLNNYILFRNSASKPESYRFGVLNTTHAKKVIKITEYARETHLYWETREEVWDASLMQYRIA